MAETVEKVIRVRIEADGSARLADGTRLTAAEVRALGDALDKTGEDVDRFGQSGEQAGRRLAAAGRDIAQGDWRGAAANMGEFAARTGAVQTAATGMGAALGLATTVVAAFGVAIYQAREETERQANALLLTGNYAGLVGGQLNQMAREAAGSINGTVGGVRQTMESLVASGRVTGQSLDAVAKAVELVSQISGRSREDVVKDFTAMSNGVASWAAKTNESYHFITYEQYKYIESLEQAGNRQEAMRVTSEALNQHLGGDLTRNMGVLERGWHAIRTAASGAWDAMLNVGREKTAEDRVRELTAQLDALTNRRTTGRYTEDQRNALVDTLRAQLETAQESARLERRAADERSRRAQEDEARIAADRDKKKKQDDGDSTYERLNSQIERRLTLARAEEEQSGKLSIAERYRLEGLQQIAAVEEKIGPRRAEQLRALVNETAEILRNNQQRAETARIRELNEERSAKALQAQEREVQAIVNSNTALQQQIEQVGKTKAELADLRVARIDQALATERENLLMAQNIEGNDAQVRLIERRIALLERQSALTRELGTAQAAEETRQKAIAENKRYSEELRRDLTTALQHAFAAGKDPAEALGAALETAVKVRLTRGIAESIMNGLYRPIEQGAGNFFSNLFGSGSGGGGFGTGSEYGNQDYGSFFHAGGMVGSEPTFQRAVNPAIFRGAPRYHTGGITGDEVPIIAKRGEGVFTPGQMKALGAGMGDVSLNVSIVNNTGSQVAVQQRRGSKGMDLELILDAVDAGLADRVGAGSAKTGKAMEGRYGLSPAVS